MLATIVRAPFVKALMFFVASRIAPSALRICFPMFKISSNFVFTAVHSLMAATSIVANFAISFFESLCLLAHRLLHLLQLVVQLRHIICFHGMGSLVLVILRLGI